MSTCYHITFFNIFRTMIVGGYYLLIRARALELDNDTPMTYDITNTTSDHAPSSVAYFILLYTAGIMRFGNILI